MYGISHRNKLTEKTDRSAKDKSEKAILGDCGTRRVFLYKRRIGF